MNPQQGSWKSRVASEVVSSEERRRQQNRDAQRNYRKRVKHRLDTLKQFETELAVPLSAGVVGDPTELYITPSSIEYHTPRSPPLELEAGWIFPPAGGKSLPSTPCRIPSKSPAFLPSLCPRCSISQTDNAWLFTYPTNLSLPLQYMTKANKIKAQNAAVGPAPLAAGPPCELGSGDMVNLAMASTPLHQAIMCGHTRAASLLIHNGADIEATTSAGQTPLQIAASLGKLDCVDILIEYGSNVNHQDLLARTALQLAVQNLHLPVVQRLIAEGADLEIANANGMMALHHAAASGNEEILSCLLDAGANVNSRSAPKDLSGYPPAIV